MQLTEIRINLCGAPGGNANGNGHHHVNGSSGSGSRLKAFCSLTFDHTFVVRDVKLIEGNDSLFLAMPSRKLCGHCGRCGEKNHLRARYCNNCGTRLNENRHAPVNGNANGHGNARVKLHADIAHPINAACREALERQVLAAYHDEVERSKQPGYVAPSLDLDDIELPAGDAGHRPIPIARPRTTTAGIAT
jgi:stage V sporulation protein G